MSHPVSQADPRSMADDGLSPYTAAILREEPKNVRPGDEPILSVQRSDLQLMPQLVIGHQKKTWVWLALFGQCLENHVDMQQQLDVFDKQI